MQRIGSRAQVMHGTAKMTGGGLKKKDLKYNKQGKIVSKKMSAMAKKEKRLQKAGYKTQKGVFQLFQKQRGGKKTVSLRSSVLGEQNGGAGEAVGIKYCSEICNDPSKQYNNPSLYKRRRGIFKSRRCIAEDIQETTCKEWKKNNPYESASSAPLVGGPQVLEAQEVSLVSPEAASAASLASPELERHLPYLIVQPFTFPDNIQFSYRDRMSSPTPTASVRFIKNTTSENGNTINYSLDKYSLICKLNDTTLTGTKAVKCTINYDGMIFEWGNNKWIKDNTKKSIQLTYKI
jgi:hypothetical protein